MLQRGLQLAPRLLRHLRILAFFLPLILVLSFAGITFRRYAWDATVPIRFNGDIANGFARGDAANAEGFANAYDHVEASTTEGNYGLDYGPLRLYVMTLWSRWRHVHFPDVGSWNDLDESRFPERKYQMTRPLLMFNTGCETASAIAIFLLVRLWVRRSTTPHDADAAIPDLYRGSGKGLLGATLFWFNPAIIQDAHCWPQWDVWCIPFYLLAILLASLDWFFTAGLVAAIGAMFKGQLMLVAPIFALWPLMERRPGAALRAAVGFASGLASVGALWLLAPMPEQIWLGTILAGLLVARPLKIYRRRPAVGWIVALVAFDLIAWPFFQSPTAGSLIPGTLAAALAVFLARTLRWRHLAYLAAGALSCAAFAGAALFDSSMAWWKIGVAYGTRHYPSMSIGDLGSMASWLQHHFQWNVDDPVWTGSPVPAFITGWLREFLNAVVLMLTGPATFLSAVSIRSLLFTIYFVTLLLASLGAALQSRRGDVRFLAAIAAPWILFFAILPQMHERYLVWAAGITAVAAGIGWGMTLMHLVVAVAAWYFVASNSGMARLDPDLWATLRPAGPTADIAWLVATAAATFLVVGLVTRRPPRPQPAPPNV